MAKTPAIVAIKGTLTTCPNNYVISKQVSANTSNPIIPIDETKRVQSQSNKEWLDEYEEEWAKECNALF